MDINTPQIQNLLKKATTARENAAAPYSGFRVGAALEDSEGNVWTGCNVESSSFGLTICAERVALTKALSEGVRSFKRIVISASAPEIVQPCGACRQLLHDYARGIDVIIYDPETDKTGIHSLDELYPYPFSDSALLKGPGE